MNVPRSTPRRSSTILLHTYPCPFLWRVVDLSWIPLYPHQNNTHVVILIGWSSGQIDGSSIANTSSQVTLRVLAGELTNSSHLPNMRPETTCNRCLNVRRHQKIFESAVGYKIPTKIIDHGCCNKCYEISTSWNGLGHLLDCVSGRLHYAVYNRLIIYNLGYVTALHSNKFKHMTRNRTKPDRKYTFLIELYRCLIAGRKNQGSNNVTSKWSEIYILNRVI